MIVSAIILLSFAAITRAEITVIANDFNIDTELTQEELTRIYTGVNTQWSDGRRITIHHFKQDAPQYKQFLLMTGINPTFYQRRMANLQSTGTVIIYVASHDEMGLNVGKYTGAIGYANSEQIIDTPYPVIEIRVIQ